MFLIDCSAQNAYSLFRLQNEASNDKKQREKQLELLAFDLIKHNVKSRYEKQRWKILTVDTLISLDNKKNF